MLEAALKSRIPDPKSPSLSTPALLEMGSLPPKRAGPSTYSSDHETSLLQGRFCWVGPGCWERNRITESPKHVGLKEQSAANLISTGFICATILPVENEFQGSWGLTKGSHQRRVVAEPSAVLQMSSSDTERPGSLQKVTQRWLTCEETPSSKCGSGRWRWSMSHTKEMESDTLWWWKMHFYGRPVLFDQDKQIIRDQLDLNLRLIGKHQVNSFPRKQRKWLSRASEILVSFRSMRGKWLKCRFPGPTQSFWSQSF